MVKQPVRHLAARVPMVMQLETLECGAACLCMIMGYYNKWIPLEQARLDCGVSRDGSNAKNIVLAARNYGFNAKGYKYEMVEDLRKHGIFPCIIHWGFNHFVVLRGFRGDKALINDPARGEVAVPLKMFDEQFTGIVLEIAPGENFEPSGKPKSTSSYILKHLWSGRVSFVFVVITTVITSLIGLISSGFSRVFMDYLLPGEKPDWVVPFFVGLTALNLIQIVSSAINAVYSLKLKGRSTSIGHAKFMWKVLRLPMSFFSQRMAGDIQGRKNSNYSISSQIVHTIAPLVLNAVMMVFYLVVMFRHSWILSLIGLLSVTANLWMSRVISKKRINITRVSMRDQGKLSAATSGAMVMIESIKASGAENGYFEKWSGYQASANTQNVRYEKLNQYLGMVPEMIQSVLAIVITIIGVWMTMQGEFTVGMIMAFQGYLTHFTDPAEQLISAGQKIQELRTSIERIEDVMEYPDAPAFDEKEEPEEYDKLSGCLSMRHVTFGYSPLDKPLIEDFNLEIRTGQRVAIVGATGCGKSTLAKLISGLYEPWEGEILFDDKPIDTIDRDVFTGSLAVVDQDIILFEDTIENNIKMWDSTIEDYEMIVAARDAQIHDDIMQRDGGYKYKITEGGRDFSGGQKQRLEIARVMAQDPTMIIMDEATSALDARTEYEVVKSIQNRGITCIVIAHRLSTIRDCDEIIFLDKGKVAERGTHEELMALNGKYRELVTSE
ncbi:MAG: NHLP family bacteriocin export ABC transporter peptidase/permease/ATPase subunit [Eubacterium sp.]|nr:NHLP family bacteriocin export ABC transporter peptidase/permease/ATPase subunit [Eubacterium sp.]